MGWMANNWEAMSRQLREVVSPHLATGEELLGVVHANQPKIFSADLFAVGVTPARLIVVPIDRKMAPAGEPIAIHKAEVQSASVWGWGGSVADFLAAGAGQQIRFTGGGRKWKLMALGGNLLEDSLSGPSQRAGLAAFVEFLLAARPG